MTVNFEQNLPRVFYKILFMKQNEISFEPKQNHTQNKYAQHTVCKIYVNHRIGGSKFKLMSNTNYSVINLYKKKNNHRNNYQYNSIFI